MGSRLWHHHIVEPSRLRSLLRRPQFPSRTADSSSLVATSATTSVLAEATIYDPTFNTWTRQPPMNLGRWYPTTTMLPNGDVLVVAGDVDLSSGGNPLPQVWQFATGTWRSLTSAQLQLPLYPNMFLAPNGRVFNAGPGVQTRYLDTTGTGAWSVLGNRRFNAVRDYGGAVMYEPGKILFAGGGNPPTSTAEVIDLNAATPAWRAVGSMNNARRQMNTTMLPDGKVLVTGGTRGAGFNNTDPSNSGARGRAVGSSQRNVDCDGKRDDSAPVPLDRALAPRRTSPHDWRQRLQPGGDLFAAVFFTDPRPTIASAPAVVAKGQTIFVGTPTRRASTACLGCACRR